VIAVVDFGMGNLRSVQRALRSVGAAVTVTADPAEVQTAERIVLPGVGAFGVAMERLRARGLVEALTEQVLSRRVPFLGICLGLQLICRGSDEHGSFEGLGWIPAWVRRIDPGDASLRVPHTGWNDVTACSGSVLMPEGSSHGVFYFVHSFHAVPDPGSEDVVSATVPYGAELTACIERDNILATQFHPEKSQEDGLALLRRFTAWQPAAIAA
jgi:imidazole glycerol-phosphate synthase subunit HisH